MSEARLGPAAPTTTVSALAIAIPNQIRSWLEGGMISTNVGFDLAFETRQLAAATRQDRQLLSIRLGVDEALIGPRWIPGGEVACAGCAETRVRLAVDHPLVWRGDLNASARAGWPATLSVLLEVGLDHLGDRPLLPGEMLRVGLTETRRHRVARSLACPMCGPGAASAAGAPGAAGGAGRSRAPISRGLVPDHRPAPLALQSRASRDAVPLRGVRSTAIDEAGLARLVDHRFGPVLAVRRDNRTPFALSGALLPGARATGYGRGRDFARAGTVAILEAYERMGAFPHQGQVIQDLPYDEVRELAIDPAGLGYYSQAQLDHPNARVMAYRPDLPMDWAYAHQLDDGEAWLVPADVAFYGYEYRYRLDQHAGQHAGRPGARPAQAHGDPGEARRVHFFAESSSGCALGSSLEEAALHALVELVERDSFLMAWCRRVPLPAIDHRSLGDHTSKMLLDAIARRGFDVHLLATTYDLGVPSVWALAVNRTPGAVPATYSAAGSSPVPDEAVRAALWELTQLVVQPVDWDTDGVRRLVEDPSLVDSIEDHVHLYTMPERSDRVTEVLGGPVTALDEAFPGWPEKLCQAAKGDVRGALEYLLAECRTAGLHQVLVVDQSTREHLDLGLRVARVVVPGILPMCFGSPQQRLNGLPRRDKALAGGNRCPGDVLLDPHPFP
jgi:ribosomal protein S12 methylthiotransferase accessory factor